LKNEICFFKIKCLALSQRSDKAKK